MRVAVISGASSGMGREFVKMTAQRGEIDEIWVIARRKERLEALQTEVRVPLRLLPLDLTREESYGEYSALLERHKPDVAFLVNASGFGKFGRYDEIPLEDSVNMIELNCKSMVRVTTLTLPYMKAGGRIVQVDSMSAFQPVPYMSIYGATKAFVLSYARSLNVELRPRNIKVMAFCPYWVQTEFFDHAWETSKTAVTNYNKIYTAEEVVRVAMRDSEKGRDVCVPGLSNKLQVVATKLLPHKLIMKIWMKQQKH